MPLLQVSNSNRVIRCLVVSCSRWPGLWTRSSAMGSWFLSPAPHWMIMRVLSVVVTGQPRGRWKRKTTRAWIWRWLRFCLACMWSGGGEKKSFVLGGGVAQLRKKNWYRSLTSGKEGNYPLTLCGSTKLRKLEYPLRCYRKKTWSWPPTPPFS